MRAVYKYAERVSECGFVLDTPGFDSISATGQVAGGANAAYPVEAIDATGAGDTFDGALLAELCADVDPFEAARYANAAAAM